MTMALPLPEPQDRSVLHCMLCTQTAQPDQTRCPPPPPVALSKCTKHVLCFRQECRRSTVHKVQGANKMICHMHSISLACQCSATYICNRSISDAVNFLSVRCSHSYRTWLQVLAIVLGNSNSGTKTGLFFPEGVLGSNSVYTAVS